MEIGRDFAILALLSFILGLGTGVRYMYLTNGYQLGTKVYNMPSGSSLSKDGYAKGYTYIEINPETDFEIVKVGENDDPIKAFDQAKPLER